MTFAWWQMVCAFAGGFLLGMYCVESRGRSMWKRLIGMK